MALVDSVAEQCKPQPGFATRLWNLLGLLGMDLLMLPAQLARLALVRPLPVLPVLGMRPFGCTDFELSFFEISHELSNRFIIEITTKVLANVLGGLLLELVVGLGGLGSLRGWRLLLQFVVYFGGLAINGLCDGRAALDFVQGLGDASLEATALQVKGILSKSALPDVVGDVKGAGVIV
ncbi:hypothetical protein V2G26_004475 [Clonostachys chloroleuca]